MAAIEPTKPTAQPPNILDFFGELVTSAFRKPDPPFQLPATRPSAEVVGESTEPRILRSFESNPKPNDKKSPPEAAGASTPDKLSKASEASTPEKSSRASLDTAFSRTQSLPTRSILNTRGNTSPERPAVTWGHDSYDCGPPRRNSPTKQGHVALPLNPWLPGASIPSASSSSRSRGKLDTVAESLKGASARSAAEGSVEFGRSRSTEDRPSPKPSLSAFAASREYPDFSKAGHAKDTATCDTSEAYARDRKAPACVEAEFERHSSALFLQQQQRAKVSECTHTHARARA